MKIVVFGTGKKLYEYMARNVFADKEIVAYCDNDNSKWGMEIGGIQIITPKEISNYEFDEIYISTDKFFDEIKEQLLVECNISESIIKRPVVEENKYDGELSFWKAHNICVGFHSDYYVRYLQNILGDGVSFSFDDKVVIDFGCGPEGSLKWISGARAKIGVDILATKYFESFPEQCAEHDMIYVNSTENVIPLPAEYGDVLFTINSLDHVFALDKMIGEILRILKTGGTLLAGFNLNEPATECEPQTLTIPLLKEKLLKHFEIEHFKLCERGSECIEGKDFNSENIDVKNEAVLWIRGVKKN